MPVRVSVAFYFTDTPPTRVPALLRLTRQDLDIPAGATRYEATSTFRTPVDLDVFTAQPHAHNLAKEVEAFAPLPDGRREPLLLKGLGLQLAGRVSLRPARFPARRDDCDGSLDVRQLGRELEESQSTGAARAVRTTYVG